MNISKIGLVSGIAAAALVISPVAAFAQTIGGVQAEGSASDNASVQSTSHSVQSSANGGVNATAGVSGSASKNSGSTNTSGQTGASTAGAVDAQSTSDTTRHNGSGPSSIDVSATGAAMLNVQSVTSEDTLHAFTQSVVNSNANVRNVRADTSDAVEVAYTHRGHFLGIFPVSVTSQTDVTLDANGKGHVVTHMPWWNMFVTGTHKVSNEVDTTLSSSVSANFSASTSASERARMIEMIVAAHEQADAAANASASSTSKN